MYSIPYRSNIDMELNLAAGKINFVLPNFIPSTFSTCIKNSKCLHFNIKAFFELHKYYTMSLHNFSKSINLTKAPADLAYETFIIKCAWLSEAR